MTKVRLTPEEVTEAIERHERVSGRPLPRADLAEILREYAKEKIAKTNGACIVR